MPRFLVTNDDGVDSPALPPLIRALRRLGSVRAVVPDRERSWIGKAITRFDPIFVREVERDGETVSVTSGFPADCANLGIHSLGDGKPEVVVSGINVGLNYGLAFLLSSGTVGAATEGWIAGLPAIALSAGVGHRGHADWVHRVWREEARADWERLARVSAALVEKVLSVGFPKGVDLLNVNMPAGADDRTPCVFTQIARVGYDDLFRADEHGRYVHAFTGFRDEGPLRGTDIDAVDHGSISITPVRLAHTAAVDEAFRRALERPQNGGVHAGSPQESARVVKPPRKAPP